MSVNGNEIIKINQLKELVLSGKFLPSDGSVGQVLMKSETGVEWSDISGNSSMALVKLWSGTWNTGSITISGIKEYQAIVVTGTHTQGTMYGEYDFQLIAYNTGTTFYGCGLTKTDGGDCDILGFCVDVATNGKLTPFFKDTYRERDYPIGYLTDGGNISYTATGVVTKIEGWLK